jgi:hypothetical protein
VERREGIGGGEGREEERGEERRGEKNDQGRGGTHPVRPIHPHARTGAHSPINHGMTTMTSLSSYLLGCLAPITSSRA